MQSRFVTCAKVALRLVRRDVLADKCKSSVLCPPLQDLMVTADALPLLSPCKGTACSLAAWRVPQLSCVERILQ